jgi:dihydrofolate reductase
MSLDGYIAKKDDNIDFLSTVEAPHEDFGYAEFLNTIDTVIWGRRTFDKVLSFGKGVPYKDKFVFVISATRTGKEEHARYESDAVALVKRLKSQPGKDIYCDGGGVVVLEFLKNQLFDRIIVNVIPCLLGDGIRLFREHPLETGLIFKRSVSYPSGLVQLWYDVKREKDIL